MYDAFGQRFSKSSGGSTNYFIYAQDGKLLEENDGGFPIDYVYLNDRPVAEIQPTSGNVYFLHDDRLGTPQVATDSGQNVTWTANYQPFGAAITSGSITQNLRLPGQYFDVESGWNHNGFRDYIPALGRYLEADPIGLAGGPIVYHYARANPNKNIDRTGLDDFEPWEFSGTYEIGDQYCLDRPLECDSCHSGGWAQPAEQGKGIVAALCPCHLGTVNPAFSRAEAILAPGLADVQDMQLINPLEKLYLYLGGATVATLVYHDLGGGQEDSKLERLTIWAMGIPRPHQLASPPTPLQEWQNAYDASGVCTELNLDWQIR